MRNESEVIKKKAKTAEKVRPTTQFNDDRLKHAAKNHNILKKELQADPKFIGYYDSYKFSLLHWATHGDHLDIKCIYLLLENGLDSTYKCSYGRTALHYACRYGHLEAVKILIADNSGPLHEKDNDSNTPKDLAIREKHQNIIDHIESFERRSCASLKGSKKNSIIELKELTMKYIELAHNHLENSKELARLYAILCDESNLALYYIGYFKKEVLEKLLVHACKLGHIKLVERLVEKEKVDVNCKVETKDDEKFPLEAAIKFSQIDVIKLLLRKGAKIIVKKEPQDTSQADFNALRTALLSKNQDCLILLLHHACTYQEAVETLKDKTFEDKAYIEFIKPIKAELERRDAFLNACKEGNVEQVSQAIKQGIFVDSDDSMGRNALFFVVTAGNEVLTKLLIDNKATICNPDNVRTSIMKSMDDYKKGENYFNIFKMLLEREFQVELKDEDKKASWGVIVGKMVTTLLYKCKRYGWDTIECKKLRSHIQYFFNMHNNKIEDNQKAYERWINAQNDYYGSYLSSDSDSEEENLYPSDKTMRKNPKVMELQKRFIEVERSVYIDEKQTNNSDVEKIQSVMKLREQEANSLYNRKPLADIRKVLTDGRQHFKEGGELNLQSSWPKKELKEDEKLYPVYNGQINGISPLADRSRIQTVAVKKSRYYVASYRGYTYITTSWNKDARRAHRKKNELHQPLYSMAVQFESSNTSSFRQLHNYENELNEQGLESFKFRKQVQARLIKEKLKRMRTTGISRFETRLSNQEYRGLNMINNFSYENLSELLQVVYTTNYGLYFKLLSTEFFKNRLATCHSPYVSTAETPYHALRYAYGIKTFPGHQDEALKPRWRANGRAERPYSGKVYIILHPIDDIKDAHRITSLLFAGKCQILKEIAPEREVSHFSFIDKDRIVYQHIAKYPSFNGKYKKIYLYKYGLDEDLYNLFKNFLAQCRTNNTLDRFTNLLAEYLCAYHEMRFVSIADQEARKRNGTLVYLDEFGQIKEDGLPATYSTPDGNLSGGSPQKKHKDKVIKPEVQKRKENKGHDHLINDDIFESRKVRIKRLGQLIINMKRHDPKQLADIFQDDNINIIEQKVNLIEQEYTTLLHYAILINNKLLIKNLLEFVPVIGKNKEIKLPFAFEYINLRDKHGNTPLHLAALNSDNETYNLLIERGADTDIMNYQGLFAASFMLVENQTAKEHPVNNTQSVGGNLKQDDKKTVARRLFTADAERSTAEKVVEITIDEILKEIEYYTNSYKSHCSQSGNMYDKEIAEIMLYKLQIQLFGLLQEQEMKQPILPTNNKIIVRDVLINGATYTITEEIVIGDGWCAFSAVGIDNPEDALLNLEKNLTNPFIVDRIAEAIFSNYYAYRLKLNENFEIDGNDNDGQNINDKINSLYDAVQVDQSTDNRAQTSFINYLKNQSVQISYLKMLKEQAYANTKILEAVLSLSNKKLGILIDQGNSQLTNISNDDIIPGEDNKSTVYIIQRPNPRALLMHYDRVTSLTLKNGNTNNHKQNNPNTTLPTTTSSAAASPSISEIISQFKSPIISVSPKSEENKTSKETTSIVPKNPTV